MPRVAAHRHRLAAVLILLSGLLVTARAARAADQYESLAQIIARWREYVQRYRDVPREVPTDQVPRVVRHGLTEA